jgi:hypothetical protein
LGLQEAISRDFLHLLKWSSVPPLDQELGNCFQPINLLSPKYWVGFLAISSMFLHEIGRSSNDMCPDLHLFLLYFASSLSNLTTPFRVFRAALHLEAGSIPLEADCMKFQSFFGLEAGLNYTL